MIQGVVPQLIDRHGRMGERIDDRDVEDLPAVAERGGGVWSGSPWCPYLRIDGGRNNGVIRATGQCLRQQRNQDWRAIKQEAAGGHVGLQAVLGDRLPALPLGRDTTPCGPEATAGPGEETGADAEGVTGEETEETGGTAEEAGVTARPNRGHASSAGKVGYGILNGKNQHCSY